MNIKNDVYLCSKYPHVFADRHGDMRNTCMMWGFECGDGWFDLLNIAAAFLEPLIVKYIKDHPEERNPFHWCGLLGPWGYIRNPKTLYLQVKTWLKAEIWPAKARPWWPRAAQVKEKYGTLRFYLTHETDQMSRIVRLAEEKSAVTCETCGARGRRRGKVWLSTKCTPCWRKEQNER